MKRRRAVRLSALTATAMVAATLAAGAACMTVFGMVYSRALTRDAQLSAQQAVQQAAVAVDNTLDGMRESLTAIVAAIRQGGTTEQITERVRLLADAQEKLCAVMVYNESGDIRLCTGSAYPLKKSIYKDLSFDRSLLSQAGDFTVSRPHVETAFEGAYLWVVTAAARVNDSVCGDGVYVTADFRFSALSQYIDRVSVGRRGYCYITDNKGAIIYHPQQQVLFAGLKTEPNLLDEGSVGGVYVQKGFITAVASTGDGRWQIVGKSYTDELYRERDRQILIGTLLSLLIGTVLVALVLWVYYGIVTRPVRRLLAAMHEFETRAEEFSYTVTQEPVAELQALSQSFAHMAKQIRELMEQVRREETELRKTELKALQAQINPHFLYNTLDSIQWMCEQGKTEDASRMVGALARLFRISISRGRELIPLRDEIQHAKNYLVIQSYRYREQFRYRFDVEEGLEEYLCNKITLQPLIENAIYHGMDRMVDEGEIVVTVKQAPDCPEDILLIVSDNGIGMTEEQCRKILEKQRSDSGGIGVKNVNDRLRIYFGSHYGLTIHSELDVGTTVTVRIPKLSQEEQPHG